VARAGNIVRRLISQASEEASNVHTLAIYINDIAHIRGQNSDKSDWKCAAGTLNSKQWLKHYGINPTLDILRSLPLAIGPLSPQKRLTGTPGPSEAGGRLLFGCRLKNRRIPTVPPCRPRPPPPLLSME
jgi:hypothetical protein